MHQKDAAWGKKKPQKSNPDLAFPTSVENYTKILEN